MTERPKPEDFGYVSRGFNNEGGWEQQGGEEAYFEAFHEWEKQTPLIVPENLAEAKADANIGIFPTLTPEQKILVDAIKEKAYQNGYRKREEEEQIHHMTAAHIAELIRESFEEGKTKSELRTIHAQPYEIESDITVEYGAKGECKPKASVKITRFLEDGSNISELIKADLARGVEEMMTAISEIQKRNVKT